jgi:hypothetical protein
MLKSTGITPYIVVAVVLLCCGSYYYFNVYVQNNEIGNQNKPDPIKIAPQVKPNLPKDGDKNQDNVKPSKENPVTEPNIPKEDKNQDKPSPPDEKPENELNLEKECSLRRDDCTFFSDWFALDRKGEALADKWVPYFKMYCSAFGKYRMRDHVTFLEIGVQSGGSTYMWLDYFSNVTYYGMDINTNCKQFERENVNIIIGDQSKPADLENLKKTIPVPDIILDDGGHAMNQQRTSFKYLWGWLKEGGTYCCEDTHTSYWSNYGGGYKKSTFVELMKDMIDIVHKNHWKEEIKLPDDFENENGDELFKTINTISVSNSIFCLTKGEITPWRRANSGTYTIPYK